MDAAKSFARDSDNPQGYLEHEGFKEILVQRMPDETRRVMAIQRQIDGLEVQKARLTAKQSRNARILDERFHALLYRYVGFELFDPRQAYLLPKTTYLAQSGKYVLLGFSDQVQADEFFDAAHKLTN